MGFVSHEFSYSAHEKPRQGYRFAVFKAGLSGACFIYCYSRLHSRGKLPFCRLFATRIDRHIDLRAVIVFVAFIHIVVGIHF